MGSMDIRDLRARVENINALPTIPGVLKRLLGVIENPGVSLNEISNFISNDPALTTKVLKMVNSPIYGFPGRISSVNQAVILLGLNVVKGLLLGVSVFELMQKTMIGLWEHSLGCAIAARLIAEKKGLKEPEEASIDGLLHDIGKVLLILQFPEEYEEAMRDADIGNLSIYGAERAHFGTTHASVGSWMAQKWRFPQKLVDVIEYHHKPHLSKNAPVESAIVHLADILVRARGFGFAGDHTLMAVNPESWQMLDLSEADLRDILGALEESLEMTEELSL
ncbi:MAG: HDOD domain-containing protein [Syntrophorhabdaceae bacterium]|nr:HDOD domain-containing protein [Syntrophorhabdaceae bacterium]MDD5244848.1 HDOD domain-containing protein [Syntrophorhabdaceae bacterium]